MIVFKWMALAATTMVLATGCKKEQRADAPGALPPADDWQAPAPMMPHGGEASGGDPHGGMDMGGGDPHGGMDMGGAGGDPHAGMEMADPAMAAITPPNPDRQIDETRFLRGSIVANEKTAGLIKSGAIMFISVKPIDPNTGELIGNVIAVDRIDVAALPVTFHLTERNAMAAGTQFTGTVLINARVDGDGEARSRSPGDLEGTLRATIPSDGLTLTLDSVLR